jgi:uncharacterized protein (DUF934 family)
MANLLTLKGEFIEDSFSLITDTDATLPEGDVIVPLSVWLAQKDSLLARSSKVAVWIAADETAEQISEHTEGLAFIAIDFPKFIDGRGYTTARLLAEQFGFNGTLRAIGDVLIDQLFFYHRVGFTEFDVREDQVKENAIAALSTFSETYQISVEQPEPLFRRRA